MPLSYLLTYSKLPEISRNYFDIHLSFACNFNLVVVWYQLS